jgi:hypothetical protein
VLVGLDPDDPDFSTIEEQGGDKTVTPTGTNSVPVFTGNAMPSHLHGVGTIAASAHTSAGSAGGASSRLNNPTVHTMSGSTASVSAGTPTGAVSAPVFTGDATSVVQPYEVVYFWKRIA